MLRQQCNVGWATLRRTSVTAQSQPPSVPLASCLQNSARDAFIPKEFGYLGCTAPFLLGVKSPSPRNELFHPTPVPFHFARREAALMIRREIIIYCFSKKDRPPGRKASRLIQVCEGDACSPHGGPLSCLWDVILTAVGFY